MGSVILGSLVLWAMEYLFGLELLRPMFLWIALKPLIPDLKARLKRTAMYYLPYVIVTGFYLYWRFFLYQGSVYTIDMATTQNGASLLSPLSLVNQVFRTAPLVSAGAWLKVLQQPFLYEQLSLSLALVYGVVLIGVSIGLTIYFKTFAGYSSAKDQRNRGELLIVALLLLASAGLPFYLLNLPVRLTFPEDRFTLPFIPGVSLLIVGLLAYIKNASRRFTLAALMIPLAMTVNIHTTDAYRNEWKTQRSFLWQLAWRAPEIEPGTTFLAEDRMTFPHGDDEALAFMINWAYFPDAVSSQLTYEYFWISARRGNELPSLRPGLPVVTNHHAAIFNGTTDQILVMRFSPPSCLRVLDPKYDGDAPILPRGLELPYTKSEIAYFALPRTIFQALPLSQPGDLISNGDQPPVPEWLFGEEPEYRWCYYFQKADLARQSGNWGKVAELGDRAFGIPYYPDDPAEYLPFVEAYGRLGRLDEARVLTEKATDLNPALRPMFCAVWQRIETANPQAADMAGKVKVKLKYCP